MSNQSLRDKLKKIFESIPGFVGAASIAVLGSICVYMKRKRLGDTEPNIDEDSLVNPSQMPQPQLITSGLKMDTLLTKHRQHFSGSSNMFKIYK